MNSVETEGKTIDEAIAAALKLLDVERDRVEIEILAEASRGFLGIGGKKARIRATVRPSLERQGYQTETAPLPLYLCLFSLSLFPVSVSTLCLPSLSHISVS